MCLKREKIKQNSNQIKSAKFNMQMKNTNKW